MESKQPLGELEVNLWHRDAFTVLTMEVKYLSQVGSSRAFIVSTNCLVQSSAAF